MTTGILIPGRSGKNDALQGKLKVKNSYSFQFTKRVL